MILRTPAGSFLLRASATPALSTTRPPLLTPMQTPFPWDAWPDRQNAFLSIALSSTCISVTRPQCPSPNSVRTPHAAATPNTAMKATPMERSVIELLLQPRMFGELFAFGVRAQRLVPSAPQHRQARIFGKPRISRRPLAQVENRPAVRLHAPHEPAIRTKTHARLQPFCLTLAHLYRIAPRRPCSGRNSPASSPDGSCFGRRASLRFFLRT